MLAVTKVPRYRKLRGLDRLIRWSGLWRRYNNSLVPAINRRYERYLQQAREESVGTTLAPSAAVAAAAQRLAAEGLCHLPAVMPHDSALALGSRFTELIERGDPGVHQHHRGLVALRRPLAALGESCLEIFDGTPGAVLRAHYGAPFRFEWIDCYRTTPGAERRTSWLWHMDNVPAGCLKAMLLLSDAGGATGAMRYMTRADTIALHGAGYFGARGAERELDLSRYARKAGIVLDPRFVEGRAGDVLLFDPNILHCGEPPQEGRRDVMTMFVLPSRRPWREAYAALGQDRVQSKVGGYPSSPDA